MQKSQQKIQPVALRQDAPQVLPKEFSERIELCRGTHRSNCIGTALYLVGKRTDDLFVSPEETDYPTYLHSLKRLNAPSVGCLAVWAWQVLYKMPYSEKLRIEKRTGRYPNYVCHMGVVASLDPTCITYRVSSGGQFIENQPLAEIQGYKSESFELLYYAL